MLVYADGNQVMFECEHCYAKQATPPARTARSFMTAFNRFKRRHEWRCVPLAKHERLMKDSAAAVDEIVGRMKRGL